MSIPWPRPDERRAYSAHRRCGKAVQRGLVVRLVERDAQRLSIAHPERQRERAGRLGGEVGPGPVRPRPAAAVGRDRHHDEVGVSGEERGSLEAPARVGAGLGVLHQHVRAFEQRVEEVAARDIVEVGDHAAFAGVQIVEGRALLGIRFVAGEGSEGARGIAPRRLHLDHVGAEVGKEARAIGSRHFRAELHDAQIVEGPHHAHATSPPSTAAPPSSSPSVVRSPRGWLIVHRRRSTQMLALHHAFAGDFGEQTAGVSLPVEAAKLAGEGAELAVIAHPVVDELGEPVETLEARLVGAGHAEVLLAALVGPVDRNRRLRDVLLVADRKARRPLPQGERQLVADEPADGAEGHLEGHLAGERHRPLDDVGHFVADLDVLEEERIAASPVLQVLLRGTRPRRPRVPRRSRRAVRCRRTCSPSSPCCARSDAKTCGRCRCTRPEATTTTVS